MTTVRVPHPQGLVCTGVRWMNHDELVEEGWEDNHFDDVVALEFSDGSIIYASCDPEGNAPGCLYGKKKDGVMFYVVPLDQIKE